MKPNPKRLLDDDAFRARTGIDLAAESAFVPAIMPNDTQARVFDAVLAGTPTATALSTATTTAATLKAGIIGLLAGVAIGAGAMQLSKAPIAEIQSTSVKAPVRALPPVAAPALGMPATLEPKESPHSKNAEPVGRSRVAAVKTPSLKPSPTSEPAKRTSSLAAELRDFQRAEIALSDQRHAVAAKEYKAYLKAYKKGSLRTEAELGLLKAFIGAGDFPAAYKWVQRLLKQKKMRGQRASLLLFKSHVERGLHLCERAERTHCAALTAGAPGLTAGDITSARTSCDASAK